MEAVRGYCLPCGDKPEGSIPSGVTYLLTCGCGALSDIVKLYCSERDR